MHPVAFQIGGLTIYWYGVLVALGFLAGLWTATRRAPLAGIAAERIVDLGPWLIVGGIVGSRLFYVISYWREEFAAAPWWEMLMIRRGGLVFYGGFAGAALAGFFYLWRKQLPALKVTDILAPSIALGYAFGRFGCFTNGCCYGQVCRLPWAVQFPSQSLAWEEHHRAGLVGLGDPALPVHPTQLYEALSGLILYLLLAWRFRHRRFDGEIFTLYLLGNAILRFTVEFFRGDYVVRYLGGWATPAQLLCLALFAAGLLLAGVLWRRHRNSPPTAQPPAPAQRTAPRRPRPGSRK